MIKHFNYYVVILFLKFCYTCDMNYEFLLREHSLKATPQRVGILSLIHIFGHLDVEDLFKKIREQFSAISLATLYKNINSMMEKGLITEIKIPHQKSKYEIAKEPHIHLLCQECGEFIDLKLDIGCLVNEATKESHYKVNKSFIVLSGLCEKCKT